MSLPRVLDPCCGSRMMWFDSSNEDTLFGDIRSESHILCDGRLLWISENFHFQMNHSISSRSIRRTYSVLALKGGYG